MAFMSKAGTKRPEIPAPVQQTGRSTAYTSTANTAVDVYGRFYQRGSLPVFLTTGTNLVWDRMGNGSPGNSHHGGFVDIDSLTARADATGHAWGVNEIGMPPQEWLDAQEPSWASTFNPGYGSGSPPTLPTPPSGAIYSWRAEFDKDYYETIPTGSMQP